MWQLQTAGTQSVLGDTFFWQRRRTPNIFLLPVLLWEYLPCCKNGFRSSCFFKDFYLKKKKQKQKQAVQIKWNTVTGTGEECVHSHKQWKVLSSFSLFGKVIDIKLFLKCVKARGKEILQ